MSTINYTNPRVDLTVRIFDEFYGWETVVPTNEYDAVLSFFQKEYKDTVAAKNFTVTLFKVAEDSGTPVMTLLDQINGRTGVELTAAMAYYLNRLRSASTLLGVDVVATPHPTVARNIRI